MAYYFERETEREDAVDVGLAGDARSSWTGETPFEMTDAASWVAENSSWLMRMKGEVIASREDCVLTLVEGMKRIRRVPCSIAL